MAPAPEPENDIRQAVSGLMELAGLPKDQAPTAQNIQEAVDKLRLIVEPMQAKSGASTAASPVGTPQLINKAPPKNVLIAGQLGIILHQLRQALGKLGGEITLANDLEAALELHSQKDYGLIIIDLFMPTEREGLYILDEVQRVLKKNRSNAQIIILAPNSRDQNLRDTCLGKGATFFLEKIDGWHKTILGIYLGTITTENFGT